MTSDIKVSFRGKDIYVKKDTTYKEVGDLFQSEFDFDILTCCSNNSFVDLSEKIKRDCVVEFYDRSSSVGARVYSRSSRFILLVAVRAVLGNEALLVCHHTQDCGVYCTIENVFVDEEIILKIESVMKDIVKRDYLFDKITVSRIDAIKYFKERSLYDKANVLKYISNTYVNLYKLSNNVGYFYGKMAYSTGQIELFSLNYIKDNGFVMQLPSFLNPNVVLNYHHYPMIFDKFIENTSWGKMIGIQSASDINKVVSRGHIDDIIHLSEIYFDYQLTKISDSIIASDKKIVLMAGPSSSGKTTTSKRLGFHLKSLGYNPHPISTDDYFVNAKDTPRDKDGNYDYEGLQAVDLKLFNEHMKSLLAGEEIGLPHFNFMTGKREFNGDKLKLGDNDIIIIEGLHALNDALTPDIKREDKYKIYISPLMQINIDNNTHVHTSDVRKLRRIVRDNKTRNKSASKTLKLWASVNLGEINNIFPYQDDVDGVINSSLIYEIGVLKTYVEPLLYNVSETSEEYGEALRLINFLRNFLPIPADSIPTDSVLREFIGGSYFD